ncbi:S8 family serine peptidase [uncultured Pseudodesulfovibrio sp.]|uniref:S8 family serine peptidase n=1 Tax=uncultured Pseudodesulfovibrio sp. TaxID=2035858 RepID=UPI0029C66DD5|nr:S8 family serine peptidase [uncultured Pseudodesulfovibrio sp.]
MRHYLPLSRKFVFLLLAFILGGYPNVAWGDAGVDTPRLYFERIQVDPLRHSLDSGLLGVQESETAIESEAASGATRLFSVAQSARMASTYGYYIVQFNGPVQTSWKSTLKDLGATFYDYIPQYAFIIGLSDTTVAAVEELGFVRWIGKYVPTLKFSQKLYDVSPQKAEEENYTIKVRVLAFPDEKISDIGDSIAKVGGTVLSSSATDWSLMFNVTIPLRNVEQLKNISGVKWVEQTPDHRTQNNIALGIVQARAEQEKIWPHSSGHLFGEGQTVAICDSGIDTGTPATLLEDFSDGLHGSRVENTVLPGGSLYDYSGHGTHVAGIIAGNGILSGASPTTDFFPSTCYAGVAPKAHLYFQSVGSTSGDSRLPGIPVNLEELFQPAYDAGARIHSDSWGTSGAGSYSSESVAIDQFMWTHKDFLIVAAAGNAGYDKDLDGVTDPYCIDSPATAKNSIAVGASESYRMGDQEGFAAQSWGNFRTYGEPIKTDVTSNAPYGVAAFSSRGPTLDGRYKPDILAPGTNILSTRSSYQVGNGWGAFDDSYYWSGGTSMATPLVAGTAAVMREYLIKEEDFVDPSAALIKASLLNGADSLVPGQYGWGLAREVQSSPDFVQGWGRLNFKASINSDSHYTVEYFDINEDPVSDNSYRRTFSFDVANDGKPFKTTLSWTDYPGSEVAQGGLVNDLDLRVQQPDGTWVYPDNAMDASPLVCEQYVTSVDGFYREAAIGLRVTLPSSPSTLESVVIAYANPQSRFEDVSIVVYQYDSGVRNELFRKTFAYIPSGEIGLPVGLTLSEGEVFIAVEKAASSAGVYCKMGNATGRGAVWNGSAWETAAITPALIACFRTQAASTDFDRLNNTVSVTISAPQSGTYTAEVLAHNIPVGPQPYALVMSGMTEEPTSGDVVEINPDQPNASTATMLNQAALSRTAADVNAVYGTQLEAVYGKQQSFSVLVPPDGVISMRFPVSGLPAMAANQFSLNKLLTNGTHRGFTYASFKEYVDGKWWLTDVAGGYVDPVQIVNPNATYYVESVVQDGGDYDENTDPGRIDDPQVFGVASFSSGGCTIGATNDYGLVAVVLLAALSLLSRRLLSRRNKS